MTANESVLEPIGEPTPSPVLLDTPRLTTWINHREPLCCDPLARTRSRQELWEERRI